MRKRILTSICIVISLASLSKATAQTNQSLDAELTVARSNVYVNETIQITLNIRSAGLNIGQDISIIGMPGEDQLVQIGEYLELAPKIDVVNGVEIRTRRFVGDFRPLIIGSLSINPRLQLTLLTRRRSLFGTSVVHHSQHTLRVKPLNLSVTPLPKTNIPKNFEGAVGRFSLRAEINPTQVQVGDLINVTTTVKGKGYMEDITPIGIPEDSGFKAYDPKATKATPNMRQFLQTIVVTSTNTTIIPKMSFTYFDPEKSKFITQYTEPTPIEFQAKQNTVIEKFQPELPLSSKSDAVPGGDSIEQTLSIKSKASYWLEDNNVRTTIVSDQPLYFAPSHTSLITVKIPANGQIEILSEHNQWYKVQYDENRGWIPITALLTP